MQVDNYIGLFAYINSKQFSGVYSRKDLFEILNDYNQPIEKAIVACIMTQMVEKIVKQEILF